MLLHQVAGSGSPNAEIIILGESPSDQEIQQKEPFVGPSGRLLRKKLEAANINTAQVRFENVVERQISNSRELFVDPKETIPTEEFREWIEDCKNRMLNLRPKVIVTCGNTAMFAMTGKSGINDYHCTPMTSSFSLTPPTPETSSLNHSSSSSSYPFPPILPVFHPAAVLRAEFMSGKKDGDTTRLRELSPWLVFGLQKAKEIAKGAKDKERTFVLQPSFEQVHDYAKRLETASAISIDIECFNNEITCIGFSPSPTEAICIPLAVAGGSYWPEDEEIQIWKTINDICSSSVPKIMQNFIFDTMILSRFGIETCGEIFDTMLASSILHAELGKGLDDLARLYTFAPAWKGGRDWSASVNPNDLWHYNATDAAITFEIKEKQEQELHERKLHALHHRHIIQLIPRVYEICSRGFRADGDALSNVRQDMENRLGPLLIDIAKETSPDFNPRSPQQVKEYLRSQGLIIPSKDGKETTDRRALLKLQQRHPENKYIPLHLQFTKAQKLLSTYGNVKLDPDGRLRFSVNIGGTKSGRFSSSQTPWDTGLNSQNIPSRDPDSPFNFRHIIVSDENHKLVQVDLKQAEARVVCWLAREETMERIFEAGGDIHTETANRIFRMDIRTLPEGDRKRRRYLGKKSVHSFNYGMQAITFSDSCLDEAGLVVPLHEAEEIRAGFFQTFSRIPLWHHDVQRELRRSRTLTSPWGRTRSFHGVINDELYREAYSFLPQATVADTINECWIRMYEQREASGINFFVGQQGHDSILASVAKGQINEFIDFISNIFSSVAFKIHGIERTIPFDVSVGENWRDLKEIDPSNRLRVVSPPNKTEQTRILDMAGTSEQ